MTFRTKNNSGRVCCYTLMEMLVVMAILTILMAIGANIGIKSKKAIVGQYKKLVSVIPAQVDAQPPKKDAAASAVKTSVNIPDEKISALKNTRVSGKTKKRYVSAQAADQKKMNTSPKQSAGQRQQPEFPEPMGITPKKAMVTIFTHDDPKTELFAAFLFQKGSSCSLNEYRRLWAVDVKNLKKEKKFKLEYGINIPIFSQYLRKKTIFETSPYRTYILRKRILLAACPVFNEKECRKKYKAEAEKKFRLWKFDKKEMEKRKKEFVEKALNMEKELDAKRKEYIRKTLEAEFCMLKNDPFMKNIW